MIFLINRFSLKDQWFDSHRLTKSNMAPRGNLFLWMYIQPKNKLWTVVICVIFTFLCLSLIFLSDSAAFFLFICSSVLMKFRSRMNVHLSIRWLRIAVSIREGRTFEVFNESLPMVWTSSVETALRPTNDSRVSPLRKGRCRGALFFFQYGLFGN